MVQRSYLEGWECFLLSGIRWLNGLTPVFEEFIKVFFFLVHRVWHGGELVLIALVVELWIMRTWATQIEGEIEIVSKLQGGVSFIIH